MFAGFIETTPSSVIGGSSKVAYGGDLQHISSRERHEKQGGSLCLLVIVAGKQHC